MSAQEPYFYVRFRMSELDPHWYLRGTAWTMKLDHADHFPNKESAQVALNTAGNYIPSYNLRRCRIVQKGGTRSERS